MSWDPVSGMTDGSSSVQADLAAAPTGDGASTGSPASAGGAAASTAVGLPVLAPLVARELDAEAAPGAAAVQREEAVPGGSGGGTAATGDAMPEAQLDDLARRLHERISARLSRDLLIERERVGSLVDRTW
jgi:hypothetical protein